MMGPRDWVLLISLTDITQETAEAIQSDIEELIATKYDTVEYGTDLGRDD